MIENKRRKGSQLIICVEFMSVKILSRHSYKVGHHKSDSKRK